MRKLGEVCAFDKLQGLHRNLPYVGLEHIESNTARFTGSLEPQTVKSTTFRFSPEHVLYGRLRPYLNKVLLPDFDGHCSTEIFPIKPKREILRRYLMYWLLDEEIANRINETSTGARMPRADMEEVLGFEIPVPAVAEQQRIVAILDKTFAAIDKAAANAKRAIELTQAILESELGKISRGVFGGSLRKLSDIAVRFDRGKSRHRPRNAPHLYGGKYPFVQTGDVRNANHVMKEYSQTYSEAGLAQSRLWPRGTVCITIAANIAETAILGFDACFPDSIIGVVPDPSEAESDFVQYSLQAFKSRLKALGKGSAQHNINLATFESEYFPFPSISMQKRIVARLNFLRERNAELGKRYQSQLLLLEELRESMLHYAFTGKLSERFAAETEELAAAAP